MAVVAKFVAILRVVWSLSCGALASTGMTRQNLKARRSTVFSVRRPR